MAYVCRLLPLTCLARDLVVSVPAGEEMNRTIDPQKREELIREAFIYAFEHDTDMPMVSLSHPVAINPETIETWTYPGVTSNGLSHWHLIQPAR